VHLAAGVQTLLRSGAIAIPGAPSPLEGFVVAQSQITRIDFGSRTRYQRSPDHIVCCSERPDLAAAGSAEIQQRSSRTKAAVETMLFGTRRVCQSVVAASARLRLPEIVRSASSRRPTKEVDDAMRRKVLWRAPAAACMPLPLLVRSSSAHGNAAERGRPSGYHRNFPRSGSGELRPHVVLPLSSGETLRVTGILRGDVAREPGGCPSGP
jgi:hypothetical protein